jgi:membrane protein implicated in regulation of membrane protease activity
MTLGIWLVWMVIAAAFIIGEIFTLGFFLLWFGVGAAVAGILAMFGLGGSWQWGAFAVVSGVLFVLSRRFAERFSKKQPPGIGADRFVNKKGVVLEEIDNIKNSGRIRMGKEEWRAESDTGEVIPVGKMVEVTKLVGTHVVVKTLKEGE